MIQLPRSFISAATIMCLFALANTLPAAEKSAEIWKSAPPESQGFSSTKLDAVRSGLAAQHTKAFLVIRNDTIVCEWYAPDFSAEQKHGSASLAKALVGGMSFAVAMSDGRIALDDPASKFIPQWRDDSRKSRITLRQLGSHTSGIEDAEDGDQPHNQLTGWKGDFWKRLAVPNDPFTLARDRAPLIFNPGQKMEYSNPGIALMTYCVTAALWNAPQKDIRSLLRERIMKPIGVSEKDWSVGYGQTVEVDGLPLVSSWGGGAYTARAAARLGRLMLRGGDWDGQRLLDANAVRQTTSDAGTPGPCGMGWWSNNEDDFPKMPRDAFFGSGAGHQIVLVIPSLKIIAVRFGDAMPTPSHEPHAFHEAYRQFLFDPLMDALSDRPITP
ncbi:beta-lactamase [Chthoniobacter flavus Ellin428]|uniref:Beta-lactamase n=1 Tax=Chthoniobacter flavus Ellin428 TaxID=497964 RepID=B4DAT2_9BACT|nr:serine hydrolase [Chthoniobacter flavus]EDY16492.1 beta-lactamase [Chthoniobacter flavus Ellin428]